MEIGHDTVRKVDKPWGYELIYARTERYVGKILFVKKGHRLSLQYHEKKDETMFIQRGKIELQSGAAGEELATKILSEGDAVRLRPLTRHRVQAIKDTYILEVSTPELEDVVRLSDDYGRA